MSVLIRVFALLVIWGLVVLAAVLGGRKLKQRFAHMGEVLESARTTRTTRHGDSDYVAVFREVYKAERVLTILVTTVVGGGIVTLLLRALLRSLGLMH